MRGERKQLAKCGHYTPSADNLGATKEVAARMRCLSKKQETDGALSKHMRRCETLQANATQRNSTIKIQP